LNGFRMKRSMTDNWGLGGGGGEGGNDEEGGAPHLMFVPGRQIPSLRHCPVV